MPSIPEKEGNNILVVTADDGTRIYLNELLRGEGNTVFEGLSTAEVLTELSKNPMELVMLDFENPSAIDICKEIRRSFSYRHTPIIILVSREHTMEKIKGIYAGADDYIEKPINAGELLTRLKANIWRANRDLDANPLTKLPGNVTILRELEKRIKNTDVICACYADLDKFKEYNDYYGFEWGDKVIKHTAQIISTTLLGLGARDDFLGHIGGDDFIFITGWEGISDICEKIITEFDKTIPDFYRPEDKTRGYIVVKDRRGNVTATAILTISIGVATNKFRPFHHVGEIVQAATELKAYAKTFAKSIHVIDRRKS